jgi:two-component system CheB/CheR fusion protein
LHELATNAVKYGALSRPEGQLDIWWNVEKNGTEHPQLHVEWRESGVADMPDPGASPQGSGYGRELIERALPFQLGARTRYSFAQDGVHCSIDMPVPGQEIAKEKQDG